MKDTDTIEELKLHIQNSDIYPMYPSDIANILKELSDDDFKYYIKKLPSEIVADVALELPDRYFGNIAREVSVEDLSVGLKELESDDQTDFIQEIEEVDKQKAKDLFNTLDLDDQEDITKLKSYNEDQAGSYMQTEVFTARLDEKVCDVIDRFRDLKATRELENVHQLFIIDKDHLLLNAIGLEDLLTFNTSDTFKNILKNHKLDFDTTPARDLDDIDEVVNYVKEHDLPVIPIVDLDGVLLGRITSDDIYELIHELATEQMYNLAGVDGDAEEDEKVFEAGKKRGIWLFLNLITAILASMVIGMFEETLQSYVALAILMPIIASMGGNAGTQTLTVVVRQLALGDISSSHAKRVLKKEILISLGNGIIFAIIIGIIASIWFDKGMLGIVIGLSMIINLLSAGFFGATIPLMLKRLDIDPAIGSTVLLTTVTDIVGFLSFLGLAKMILL